MKYLLVVLLVFIIPAGIHSQYNRGAHFMPDSLKAIVLMKPTGNMVQELPEMKVLADTAATYRTVMEHIDNSFINEFLDVYFLAQIYLKNNKFSEHIEPAYIALTNNQGGFARFGFALREGDTHTGKPHVPYVDITEGQATGPPDKLMSFTQLYPHEMGHVLYHLLSKEDSLENNTKNVDMHFFSIVTDYSTAFNEGFAEHIENVSRILEKNKEIKKGIFEDLEDTRNSMGPYIRGFKRDFVYPFRLGYYKASMLFWYQKYEDFKRYDQAISGDIRYKNAVLSLSDSEDELTFRNSGIELDKGAVRNYVQMLSTEGAVSAFFTHLTTSDLATHYMEPVFYQQFLHDSTTMAYAPEELFSPITNQFLKYIYVLQDDVVFNNSTKAQLIDFIEGYIRKFPSEEAAVKDIFRKALGVAYSDEVPPPLWVLVKDHPHRLLVFDPFDAIAIPFYTFDLNAAEIEDLMTIDGMKMGDAERIVHYRNTNGFFSEWEHLEAIPGLSADGSNRVISSALNEDYFEKTLEGYEPKLSIGALIANPLKYILTRATAYFFLLFLVMYFTVFKKRGSVKQSALLFIRYFLLWILLVLTGLVIVLFTDKYTYVYLLGCAGVLAAAAMIFYRHAPDKKYRSLLFIGSMFVLIFISIW